MSAEKSSARQRIRAAFDGTACDRIATYPMSCANNAWMMGMSIVEFSKKPEKMADAYLEYFKKFKPGMEPDILILFQDVFIEGEALGVKIELRDDAEPVWLEPAIDSPKDIKKLKIPDPEKDGRMPVMLECSSILQREVGKKVRIGAVCLGPFSLCGTLRGEEKLMMDLVENPEFVHELMKVATETIYRYGVALKKAGSSASASIPLPTLISYDDYIKFCHPYLTDLCNRWKKQGINTFYHICGQSAHLLDGIADTGCWAIGVDENIDLAEAKKIIGGRTVLTGNIDPIDTICYRPERIDEEVKECIRKAAPGGKYILSSGCEVPIGTQFENIEAFMEAAWKYGKYPINC